MIPETTISPTGTSVYSRAIFVAEKSQPYSSQGSIYRYLFNVPAPPQGKVYLIFVNRNVSRVYVYTTTSYEVTAYRNGTHTFATWNGSISDVGICCNIIPTVRLYLIDPDTPMPPPPEIFVNDTATQAPAPVISNRLILNFISWVAGIVLMLEALRRFDLEI
jgi:hypothetical protein